MSACRVETHLDTCLGEDPSAFHTDDRGPTAGASLAAETRAFAVGASRLKAGCSQDWLPHKAASRSGIMIGAGKPINNRPQVANLPHK